MPRKRLAVGLVAIQVAGVVSLLAMSGCNKKEPAVDQETEIKNIENSPGVSAEVKAQAIAEVRKRHKAAP